MAENRDFDPHNIYPTARIIKMDKVTPHKLTVVILVKAYLKVKSDHEIRDVYPATISKRVCMLLLKLIQYPDMLYKDLHEFLVDAHAGIDTKHLACFKRLMEDIAPSGVEFLFDLQSYVTQLLADSPNMHKFGVVGLYFRRVMLAFNKLSFMAVSDLYANLKAYYARGARSLTIASAGDGVQQSTMNELRPTRPSLDYAARLDDANETIEMNETIDNVDLHDHLPPPAGADPGDVHDLDDMDFSSSSPMMVDASADVHEQSKRHLSLIMPVMSTARDRRGHSQWSVRQADLFIAQQCSLLENNEIYALRPIELQQRLNEIIEDIPQYTQAHALSYMNCLRVRDFFGALNAFHHAYDLNSAREKPLPAATSSDNNQPPAVPPTKLANNGLQYSSLNLAILHMKFGHYNETLANLRECIMLAQEAGDKQCLQIAQLWLCLLDKKYVSLCEANVTTQADSSAVHSVSLGAQFVVNAGTITGVMPSKIFELLMKSEVMNFQHSLMDLVANSLSQKAALWQIYGKTELTSLCNQLLLQVVRSSRDSDCIENSEAVCLSLCSVALWLAHQGEYNLSAVVVQHASERFPRDPMSRHWQKTESLVNATQAIYRAKWTDGLNACSQLYVYDEPMSVLQRATLNIARGNGTAAHKQLLALMADDELEPIYYVRAMILMSNTFFRSESISGCETRFSAEAMGILNEASVFAKEKYLSYEAAIIDLHITYVLLLMGMPQQALKLIRNCMETILANGGVYDCARTQFLFAKCLIAAEGQSNKEGKLAKLAATVPILEEVVQGFLKLEAYAKVKDVYIYLTLSYDGCDMVAERNKWAYKLRNLEEQFPTPTEYLNIFL